MDLSPTRASIAFSGTRRIAAGPLIDVAREVRRDLEATPDASVLVFDAVTSEPIEVDFRGSVDDVAARLAAPVAAPRAPGRPKLGVVGREVTLLPRHWEWLGAQPGGASVTLRKLVDQARHSGGDTESVRLARESAYRFMVSVAGDQPRFEDATRALFAGDGPGFEAAVAAWPADIADHASTLAEAGL